MPESNTEHSPRFRSGRSLGVVLVLLIAACLTHGWSLSDGLFFDDHLHFYKLKNHDWSWEDLNEVTVVNPGHFIHMWWQSECVHWEYARPLAVAVARLVVTQFTNAPAVMHLFSITLHVLSAWCVYRLLYLLTRRTAWSLAGGYLFVVFSHSVYTVSWLASQNAVLQNTLTLMSLLAYIRASGLQLCPHPYIPRSQSKAAILPVPSFHAGWGMIALVLWLLAVASRENALILPLILGAFDLAFGGRRQVRRRLPVYGLSAAIGFAWILWRITSGFPPYPDFYVRGYDGPEYIPWVMIKLLHYTVSVVFQSPMMFGPTLRHNPLIETPGDCLLMLAIVGTMGVGYYLAAREVRGFWIWPLWILLSLLPVIPVMATPHNGYMPAVGFCIALMLAPALRDRVRAISIGRWSRPVALFFLVAITCYFPIYRTMWNSVRAAERLTLHDMQRDPPDESVKHLFFIDLPFVNVYAQLHWAELTGQANPLNPIPGNGNEQSDAPRWHVLTFANNVLRVDRRVTLTQVSSYAFHLKVTEGRPFFSGAMGRFLIEGMREHRPLQTGQMIDSGLFEVRILRADQEGVWELAFEFDRPLSSPEYVFYIATPEHAATRLTFARDPLDLDIKDMAGYPEITQAMLPEIMEAFRSGDPSAGVSLLKPCLVSDEPVCDQAWAVFRRQALPLARAMAMPIEDQLLRDRPKPFEVRACLNWWTGWVDPPTFRAFTEDDPTGDRLRRQRDRLFAIHSVANRIVRTDMYLTGPPYPGPR